MYVFIYVCVWYFLYAFICICLFISVFCLLYPWYYCDYFMPVFKIIFDMTFPMPFGERWPFSAFMYRLNLHDDSKTKNCEHLKLVVACHPTWYFCPSACSYCLVVFSENHTEKNNKEKRRIPKDLPKLKQQQIFFPLLLIDLFASFCSVTAVQESRV